MGKLAAGIGSNFRSAMFRAAGLAADSCAWAKRGGSSMEDTASIVQNQRCLRLLIEMTSLLSSLPAIVTPVTPTNR